MIKRKPTHPLWRQAAAVLLVLGLCLGMTTAQAAVATLITPLAVFNTGSFPTSLVYGPDQSLWVSLAGSGEIGQISANATSTHPLPNRTARPLDLTIGADRALWFSVRNQNQIGRLEPGAGLSEFPLNAGSSSADAVTLGQDLSLWFTEPDGNRIGRLTTGGDLTEYALPHLNSKPMGIASAQNGDLWFAEWGGYRIGKISLQGEISEYNLPSSLARPVDILVGSDGNIWVIFNSGRTVARFNPHTATFESYSLATKNASLTDLTLGPDHKIWFIGTHTVGCFELVNGAPANLTEEALPSPIYAYQGRSQIITGPDNNLLFSTANSSIIYQSVQSGAPARRDLQVFITYQPPLLLSAGTFNIDAEIVNWTHIDATGVEIDLTLDQSIHFVSAELPGGSCVDQGSQVHCTLPSLGGGVSLPVRFVMTTDRISVSPSPRSLSLEVSSAEGDYQPGNNRVVLFPEIHTSLDYFNDFSEGADRYWSHPLTSTPVDGLKVLGLFDNDQVSFHWEDLPPHNRLWLCFDLYILGPWTGSQYLDPDDTTIVGPDFWTSYVNDDVIGHASRQLAFTTFSNLERYAQAFPAEYPDAVSPSQTQAVAAGEFDGHPTVRDARYHFYYRLEHSSLSLDLVLKGLNLDGLAHEKWAIDDVRIKILYDASIDRTYLPVLFR